MKHIFFTGVLLLITLLVVGCGQKITIEEAESRIADLRDRGVPRREMTRISMYLNHMKTAKSIGNSANYTKYRDSLYNALNDFEERMGVLLEESAAVIASLRAAAEEKGEPLKGLHLKEAQKLFATVDSLIEVPSPLLARTRLETLDLQLDTLLEQQALADSLRSHFVGAWVMEEESPDSRFNVVKRHEIHLRPDGSLYMMDRSRGTTSATTRDDWEFQSEGKWDLMGDVAFKYVTNDKRVRYNFQRLDPETNRWVTESKPAYDSTVTDSSKDGYITYEVLKSDYRRFPLR